MEGALDWESGVGITGAAGVLGTLESHSKMSTGAFPELLLRTRHRSECFLPPFMLSFFTSILGAARGPG